MIDIKIIREDPERIKKATAAKQIDPSIIDRLLDIDAKRRDITILVQDLRTKRNEIAKLGQASEEGKKIKEELKELESKQFDLDAEFAQLLGQVPNPAADDVKVGKNDTENDVVRTWGEPRKFEFNMKDHVELGESLGILDIERAVKVSGARFAYLKGDGVRLEFALMQYALETLSAEGFVPVVPPTLIKTESMKGMGYMEHGGAEDMYRLIEDDLVLVGTSEQAIGPMYKDELIDVTRPHRYVGFSSCFRREAGSYGKDTRGILRVHQFDKVEMFSFTSEDESEREHEYLLSLEEQFLQGLGLPYQVIKMCTGDLGLPAARKYDLEAWIPTQNKYRELTSTSTCTDFQSRRLQIKYKDKGENKYVHMLNGTAFAIGRTIIAILENYQQDDGSVLIPEVLQKWMGKDRISIS